MVQRDGGEPQAGGFGALLLSWRMRAGLTQELLAERSGLSARTIRDLERGRARPRAATARLLGDALGLDEPARARFETATRRSRLDARPGLSAAATGPPAGVVPPAQLPADVAGFVGRDRHLRALDELLDDAGDRLATVAGVRW